MKRIPESYKSAPVDSYAREIAVCRCGGALSFSTDMNGYVIESCDRCKQSQQMQRAPRREELDPMPTVETPKPFSVEAIKCGDCPTILYWTLGQGGRPKRCESCAAKKIKTDSKEYNRRRSQKRRAA